MGSVGALKVGRYYDPTLLPNYQPELFDLDKDKLVQHNIVDEEDQIIPCWLLYDRLYPGTLLLYKVTLHGWNIRIRDGKFKRVGHIIVGILNSTYYSPQFYTLNTNTVHILKEAQCPMNSNITASNVSMGATDEDFQSFTVKNKVGK